MTKKRSKSTKARQSKQQFNPLIIVGVVVALVVVIVGAIALSNPAQTPVASQAGAPASQLISPVAYNQEFVTSDTAHVLIDVRTPEEFASGHIHGAINIPVEVIGSRLSEVPQGEPIVLYCRSGNRSAQAASILVSAGYTGVYDLGGIIDWQAAGYSLES
ncbi:MAG: rhodanese-like domain-containing protein [Anaerolineaceae bacterium]|nr:rhodanese-like domain-containing protein [Anaerolineaceae bacterium]